MCIEAATIQNNQPTPTKSFHKSTAALTTVLNESNAISWPSQMNFLRSSFATLKISIVFFSLVPILGCSTAAHRRNSNWKKDFTYIKIVRNMFNEDAGLNFDCNGYQNVTPLPAKKAKKPDHADAPRFSWVDQARCYMDSKDPKITPADKATLRNWIIESFVTLVNHAYGDFEHDSVLTREGSNAALEAVNLGLAAGGAVFGGTSFGVASTGTQGFQHSIDKNFYNSETAFVINAKMQAIRLEQLTKIREREALPVKCEFPEEPKEHKLGMSTNERQPKESQSTQEKGSQPKCYTLAEAMNDVQDLFYAGTVHRALQDINNQTSAQANAAQMKLGTLNDQTVPGTTNVTPSTATPSPSPTPTPRENPKHFK